MPSIDLLVDGESGYRLLSLMDAYSRYNQIKMDPSNEDKIAFMTEGATYCYKVMPFGLKNAHATYQRLMDKVCVKQIGKNVQVYVDDMVLKLDDPHKHPDNLEEVFGRSESIT